MEIFLQSCEWNLTTTKKSEKNRKHLKIPGINFFFCDKASGGVSKYIKILKSADFSLIIHHHPPLSAIYSMIWISLNKTKEEENQGYYLLRKNIIIKKEKKYYNIINY